MGTANEAACWLPTGVDVSTGRAPSTPLALRDVIGRLSARPQPRAVAFDADADDLSAVGWGALFVEDEDPAVRRALEPLLALRRRQAGPLFRELTYHGESASRFRRDLGIAPGPADPSRLPYHVLLVGAPERLPFELQLDLDLERSVGRLDLETAEDYARYARAVIESETTPQRARGVALFAPTHPDDPITRSSAEHLACPLARQLAGRSEDAITAVVGASATRQRLRELCDDPGTGSLLVTIGHAVRLPCGHPRQLGEQGNLICADWPGPGRWREPLPPAFLFGAGDLPPTADLRGRVALLYGCYTLGTPRHHLYERPGATAATAAPAAFVGALARAFLAHPGGGALAVVGHLDQTHEPTWCWPGAGSRVETFVSAFLALLSGRRLGSALEVFARRHGEISSQLAGRLWQAEPVDEERDEVATLWQSFHDSRSFGILGDPAVRLGPPPAGAA